MAGLDFAHLHVHTPYSFLDGGTEIEPLTRRAAELGLASLAMTDHNTLCGAVKFTESCRAYGIHPILGAEVTLEDDSHLTLLAENREGYGNLCQLLTHAHQEGGRLHPALPWTYISPGSPLAGIICLSGCRKGKISRQIRTHQFQEALSTATGLREAFGRNRFYLELQDDWTPGSRLLCQTLTQLSEHLGVETVATNNVHYATPDDAIAHEILRAIGTGTTVSELHSDRPLNAERYLKSPQEMLSNFDWNLKALENALRIAERCSDVLPGGEEITPRWDGGDASRELRGRAFRGARERYGAMTPEIVARLNHEICVITTLGFADYFLLVRSIVEWARSRGIRCTGRGSAADSCVAYCLYLTDVDVIARGLPFARFLVPGKTPDIDMDFPSDRRDEVFQHIADTYGADRVARVCTFHTFLARSAVRDVGKALCLPTDALEFLSDRLHHFMRANAIEEAFERYSELKAHGSMKSRFKALFDLCRRISGFPRHIGTHSSGVVISRVPLASIAPLEPSATGILPIWTLDKDDAETVGAIKFDVLALRTLSAVADAERDIQRRDAAFRYDGIPLDDRETYAMIQSGKAIGTFQFESAAQMSLAVSLLPDHFEDLVAAVALIRPGPVRGNAVQRFVSARNGWTRADVMHPCLEPFLAKTFGCIVFQEQVDLSIAALTGCSHEDAERFRKSLIKHSKMGTMEVAEADFAKRTMRFRPEISPKRVREIWGQISGWGGYGFIEGHAASFALTGYKTAYLSVHHVAEYYAGLMNHQPMGYYSANSLAAEARRRGAEIRPVGINVSGSKCVAAWDATCPNRGAIQLGLNLVAECTEEEVAYIIAARDEGGPFVSVLDFCVRTPLHRNKLENLILCGAFDAIEPARRNLLFALDETVGLAHTIRRNRANPETPTLGLEYGAPGELETPTAADIPDFSAWSRMLWTWRLTGVCAEGNVFGRLRDRLRQSGVVTTREAQQMPGGSRVRVAGLNIRPHRPPTRSGRPVLFTTLEDEEDFLQVICIGEALDRCTATFLLSPAVIAEGVIERRGKGASLRVESVRSFRLPERSGPDTRRETAELRASRTPSGALPSGDRIAAHSALPSVVQ
jgi:error-prone DNA polymerase